MVEDKEAAFPVGFIGLGDQGLPIAIAIAEAGYPLHVWDRRDTAADALGSTRHIWHRDPQSLAAACEAVALCVSTDADVLQVVESGLLTGLRPGTIIVNHGTGTPGAAIRLRDLCAPAGVEVLDATVSGGPAMARDKALTTMVGGSKAAFKRYEPVLRAFSAHVFHLGEVGSGQAAKLLNNMLMIMNQAGILEIAGLANDFNLDTTVLLEVFKNGSGASRVLNMMDVSGEMYKSSTPEIMASRMHYLKLDVEIFENAAEEMGVDVSAIAERGMETATALPAFLHQVAQAAQRTNLAASNT